jgi:hypothetical protein
MLGGDAAGSPLIQLVREENPNVRMPLDGHPLTAEEISTLTKWVEQGAVWPDGVDLVEIDDQRNHWSLVVPTGAPARTAHDSRSRLGAK